VIWRACDVCGSSPFHRLDCPRLGTSLFVVAVGVLVGIAATAGFGNSGGVIGLSIAEVILLSGLAVNVVLRRRRDDD
jgi:hypothetical protein